MPSCHIWTGINNPAQLIHFVNLLCAFFRVQQGWSQPKLSANPIQWLCHRGDGTKKTAVLPNLGRVCRWASIIYYYSFWPSLAPKGKVWLAELLNTVIWKCLGLLARCKEFILDFWKCFYNNKPPPARFSLVSFSLVRTANHGYVWAESKSTT